MLSRESDKMKTAILCLGLFSVAFALPIAQPRGANTLRNRETEQKASPSAVVSQAAKAEKETAAAHAAAVQNIPSSTVHSFASDEKIDKRHKDAEIVPDHHQIEAQGVAPPKQISADQPESRQLAPQETPALNSHSDARDDSYDTEDPFLPVADDDSNGQEISHFSDVNADEFEPENNVLFDAANDPESRDAEFADDNFANEMASVDENSDVLTAELQ